MDGVCGTALASGARVASQVTLHQLLLLNVSLQIFDGVASYHGIPGWGEGNPIIRDTIEHLGLEQALLLYKAKACGFLVLVRRLHDPGATLVVYGLAAGVYGGLSFVPWLSRLGSLLLT